MLTVCVFVKEPHAQGHLGLHLFCTRAGDQCVFPRLATKPGFKDTAYIFFLSCSGIHPGRVESISTDDFSWVVSPPALPHLLALKFRQSLSGLVAPQRPLLTHSLLTQVTRQGASDRILLGKGVLITPPICWTILNVNLLPSVLTP